MDTTLLAEKIAIVFGLLIQCPLDDPLDNCPVNEFRELSTEEKFSTANNMSEDQLDDIISHHKQCIREREKKLFNFKVT